jgi:hypothetical protein
VNKPFAAVFLLLSLVSSRATAEATEDVLYAPPPAAPAGYATLIVYRQHGFVGSLGKLNYYIDGKLAATLKVASYSYVLVQEGRHCIQWGYKANKKQRSQAHELLAEPGQQYFYRQGMSVTRFIPLPVASIVKTQANFGFIEPSAAESELAEYLYISPQLARIDN